MRFGNTTMKVYARRFNLFLTLALAASLCGCSTVMSWFHKPAPTAIMRVHIELSPEVAATKADVAETVSVLRADPLQVTIDKDPVLSEANIVAARLIDTPGSPAVEVKFDENGTWVLEQYSASNPGRHFVIFGQWSNKMKDARWLAAPLITRRINDGILSFTPDMSHDEASNFVAGLINVAKPFSSGSNE
jgi:preprotein translocase subunit SecD